ncbi:hydrogenase maturation protease [Desulfuromonas sp. DDH964]|uniref:hydrogenase maturation protease n=1 Tax=Desulfuromonas sp. DDH964 TaxID=1823759 RepID=UPI0018D33BFE|nr:hydrogenase maturation protease [Desulfuromonas sp. DDH964]
MIGVGNPLAGDDGVGIAVIEELEREGVAPGVEVIDGGTGGLTLLSLMAGARAVLLVDALAMGRAPGSVAGFRYEAGVFRADGAGLSLHQAGLGEVLALAAELGELPELFIVGIEPESLELGQGLSEPVAAALPQAVAAVHEWLAQFPGR